MLKRAIIPAVISIVYCFSWLTAVGQSIDPLIFPKDNFTVETRIVKTSSGEKKSHITLTYTYFMLQNLLTKIFRV